MIKKKRSGNECENYDIYVSDPEIEKGTGREKKNEKGGRRVYQQWRTSAWLVCIIYLHCDVFINIWFIKNGSWKWLHHVFYWLSFIDVLVPTHSFVDFTILAASEFNHLSAFAKVIFFIAVCSTTLFIGKISKTTSEDELRAELEKFGSLESINVRFSMSQK